MKTQPTLRASLTTGAMLLSGVFLFAQVASTTVPAVQAPATKAVPQQTAGKITTAGQPYKDPEDMTTRAAKAPTNATTAMAANAGVSVAEQKKHLAGVKYNDRTATQSGTLDAKQANDKKGNKVDAFTIKQ